MSDRHVLPPYSLRMTAELREMLEASAKRNKRSLNAEIIARLEQAFSEDRSLVDQSNYQAWAAENDVEPADNSIVLTLARLRYLVETAQEDIRKVERLYDEKTGEHAFTADDDGNLIKSYER